MSTDVSDVRSVPLSFPVMTSADGCRNRMEQHELDERKVAHDVATLFRLFPWLQMGDQRSLDVLVGVALQEVKGFIDQAVQRENRKALMRGLLNTFLTTQGKQLDPRTMEAIVEEITRQVDEKFTEQYDSGLGGEVA